MNKAINLLGSEQKPVVNRRSIQVLRFVAVSSIFLVVGASIGLFFLVLASPLPALRREESSVASQFQAQRTKAAELFYVKERLGTVTTILAKRQDFPQLAVTILKLIPADGTVERLAIQSGSFSITVSASTLLSIQSFLEGMKQLKTTDSLFQTVTLSQLTYDDKTARYVVTVSTKLQHE